MKRTSVCSCALTTLEGTVGFSDQIGITYLYRGTERVSESGYVEWEIKLYS